LVVTAKQIGNTFGRRSKEERELQVIRTSTPRTLTTTLPLFDSSSNLSWKKQLEWHRIPLGHFCSAPPQAKLVHHPLHRPSVHYLAITSASACTFVQNTSPLGATWYSSSTPRPSKLSLALRLHPPRATPHFTRTNFATGHLRGHPRSSHNSSIQERDLALTGTHPLSGYPADGRSTPHPL